MDIIKNNKTNWAAKIMPQKVLRPSRRPPFHILPKLKQQLLDKKTNSKENDDKLQRRFINKDIVENNEIEHIHTKFKNDTLYCNSWDGVGDLLWIYNKLKSNDYKLHLDIYRTESRPIRGNQLLDNLENLTYKYHTQRGNDKIIGNIHKQCFNPNITKNEIFNIFKNNQNGDTKSLCPNLHMEHGLHLKYFWPGFELNYTSINWKKEYLNNEIVNKIDDSYVFIHPATYGSTLWSIHINDILKIATLLNKNNLKIGFTGGLYDKINWDQTKKIIEQKFGYSPIMLVGEHLATCINGLKKAKCIIGFICGLTILSLTENIPTIAVWPNNLSKMQNTITNPNYNTPYKAFSNDIFKEYNDIIINEIYDWIETI